MPQLKRVIQIQSKPVSASATVSWDIPAFGTLDEIFLEFRNNNTPATAANIVSSIDRLLFSVNGETVHQCKISQLYDVYRMAGNNVNQYATGQNVLPLNVGRYLFENKALRDNFSFGNDGINSISLQIFCSGTITGVTDINVTGIRRMIDTKYQGSFIKLVNYPQSFASTGTDDVDTLPRNNADAVVNVIVDAGGGTISGMECVANGQNIIDPVSTEVLNAITSARNMAPLTGAVILPIADGQGRSVMPLQGITEFRVRPDFSVAPTSGVYEMLLVSVRNTPAAMTAAALSNAL